MRARGWLGALTLCLACSAGSTRDQPVTQAGHLTIRSAYATAAPGLDVSSLYFTVANQGAAPDTLVAVQTAIGSAMLHEVATEGGRSSMRHVARLPVPAGAEVRLAPGGYHVMLTGLSHPLVAGDSLAVTLTFARAGTVEFPASVLTYSDLVARLEAGGEHDHQ